MTVLSEPVVLSQSAKSPMAVLSEPVVLLMSAENPRAVFRKALSQICGHWASLAGDSAKQANANGSRRNARKGEPFIGVFNERVIVFINESYEITSGACKTEKPQFSQRFTERRATASLCIAAIVVRLRRFAVQGLSVQAVRSLSAIP